DELIEEVQGGKINFDILLAHPSIMGKLAKVAKILGPRGLMPNPKAGTISENPEETAQKFAKGQIQFKTEAQAPIMHLSIGKLSMKDDELTDNIRALLTSIGSAKIKNITLKSTMSPGIKVSIR
ncbi:50S ribosomal protein L1, partial [Candidatus Microgenomates bacterium]|nr:50S ribosomal protein L1 [Candidatus Microgenomates bacterium]